MEIWALIIIGIFWAMKVLMNGREDGRETRARKTGNIAAMADPDELIKKANRTLDDLDAMRAKERENKKRPSGVQIRDFHKDLAAQERENSEKRWAVARKKQADSGEVHSVHMDSCEDRLESLKVLYDAGILDREEYTQRVARVKRQHAQSRS